MEIRKTVEELERLAAILALARDDASDVANRALRQNQLLKDELRPLVTRLLALDGGAASADFGSGDVAVAQRVKEERDRAVTFIRELVGALTGTASFEEFANRRSSFAEEQVVVSGVVRLVEDVKSQSQSIERLIKQRQRAEAFLVCIREVLTGGLSFESFTDQWAASSSTLESATARAVLSALPGPKRRPKKKPTRKRR